MRRARLLVGITLLLVAESARAQQSPWLPEKGERRVDARYVHEKFRRFWRLGSQEARLPAPRTQETTLVQGEVGLAEDLALDVTAGYTHTHLADTSDRGLTDSLVGLRWRLLDEFRADSAPTITLRVGAIIQGTYHTGFVAAPGDSANGVEASLIVGKLFLGTGCGVDGHVGYRYRTEDVPADVYGAAEGFKTFAEKLTVGVGYAYTRGLSGLDIGGRGFTLDRFPEVQEENGYANAGIGFRPTSRASVGLAYGQTLHGRNTPRKPSAVLSIGYSF